MPDKNDYFIISNPIYDAIFRYLMEDLESASIILSTFLNQKIKHIEPNPTEKTQRRESDDPDDKRFMDLFRLDFIATLELADGTEEVVMIEVQKASEDTDYFRFRRYIAKNFQKKRDIGEVSTKDGKVKKLYATMKLIPIFILNFKIETEIKELFIKTKPSKFCVFRDKVLESKTEFIDELTYELWIVQLPYLKYIQESDYMGNEYKTKVYTMLKLFDQRFILKDDEHRLQLLKEQFPEELDRIIRRLQSATFENPDLEEQMCLEDEYLRVWENKDNQIAAQYLLIEEKEKTIEEKEKTIEENQKALQEKDKALEENLKIIYSMAKLLKETGVSMMDIHKKTGLSVEEIEKI
jgi:hypothetical protein